MRLTWIEGLPQEEEILEQWNVLVDGMERPEVFFTWQWVAAFLRSYGNRAKPWIAIAFEDEDLVGVVALARPSATEASFLASTTADYCDFISSVERRSEFVDQVLDAVRESGVRRLTLANLPADSATVVELKANRRFKSFMRVGYVCAQVHLGAPSERQAMVDALFKKKMLRRSMNALRRIGPVTLQHEFGAGLQKQVVERFCNTHVARFLATGRISNLVSAQRRAFLRELATLLAERGWFDLMTLRAGTWVIALNYGLRFHGSWFWYQPTIVNKFEEMSPGYCLLAKVVEDASRDSKAQLVDLGLGAEGYKERVANGQRTTLHATLASSGVDQWKERGRYHAAETIKRVPRLEVVARRARSLAQSGRRRLAQDGWANTLRETGRQLQRSIASTEEVLFFQWSVATGNSSSAELVPLTWEILAAGAMRYSEDRQTLDYLLRSSARFRTNQSRGYALTGAEGVARHFAWVAPYEGFAMAELGEILHAPSAASVLIFDCWTPVELRGQGLYTGAISRLAGLLSAEGKDVWIFSAASNTRSIAGIEKAGFQLRAALSKRRVLRWSKTRQELRGAADPELVEVLDKVRG
ncbi:MAG TPA: GNAT family N-acetyltransferase [Terriglobales bacterium]|jgi:CelD/BcsL family acetyltransferase involved in cellulose biosynthesis|nr:GNAT family N-acetyltransferase [Terriglobales bacterium]